MDPWCIEVVGSVVETVETLKNSSFDNCQSQNDSFEDNFKPTISEYLPDSKQYLEILENKLKKIKSDPNVLRQLKEKRESCMQQLLRNEVNFNQDLKELESPVNPSAILRAVAPERQALTSGELVQLIKYDLLDSDDSDRHCDSSSR